MPKNQGYTPTVLRSPPGLGAASFRPGGGAGDGSPYGPALVVRTIPPVRQVKPPLGTDFGRSDTVSASSANSPIVIGACTYEIPTGSVGFVRSILIQVQNLLPTSDIRWRARVDGSAVPGWGNVLIPPGNVTVEQQAWGPEEIYLEVPGNSTFDLQVIVADAGTYDVSGIFHGWFVPLSVAQADNAAYGA